MIMNQSITYRLWIPHACGTRPPVSNPRRPDPAGDLRAAVPRGRADGWGADGAVGRFPAGRLKASRRAEAGWPRARPPSGATDALQRAARRAESADRVDQPDGRLLAEPARRSRRSPEEDGPM